MQHLDEGMIHAWLDGELAPAEREALEAHIAECAPCAAAVAEARGFVAASTRILTKLDSVPGGVLPAASTGSSAARPAVRSRFFASRAWMAAAAMLVLSTVTVIAVRPGSDAAQLRVAAVARDKQELSANKETTAEGAAPIPATPATPAEEKPQALSEAPARAPVVTNAPAPMQSRMADPADEPKSVDQNERLKSRLEAERQLTRARSSDGAAGAMADAAPPARAPQPPAPAIRLSEQPASSPAPSAFAKDQIEKRVDVASKYDSIDVRRSAANAQGVSITGHVTSDAGMPIASASVLLQGTGIGTVTRSDGSYVLTVPATHANGQTTSLVAKLIGYQTAAISITPDSEPITLDFKLRSNPLSLNQVIVTGAGTTSTTAKLGAVTALDSASSDSAAPRLLSRNTILAGGDTVVTTIYSVRGVSVSLIDHSRARDDALRLQVRGVVSEVPAKARAAAAAVNSISWSDSTGHTRTLRGPLTTEQLTQLKNSLFVPIATP